ncbi:MAG: hypothetical protein MI861_22005, partial [Pirellulales bacterium]|nr:hypothetical protein [Pirellulales bacterium]
KRQGSITVFNAIKKEYGPQVADRVFRSVTGHNANQNAKVTLDQMQGLKNELRYENAQPGVGGDKPAITFSTILHRAEKQANEHRELGSTRCLQFKHAKGLYFPKSTSGISNLIFRSSIEEQQNAAGGKIWQSLANQYGKQVANKAFSHVFGHHVLNRGRPPEVAVTLADLRNISLAAKRYAIMGSNYPRRDILNKMYSRVITIPPIPLLKEVDATLQRHLEDGKELKQGYIKKRDQFVKDAQNYAESSNQQYKEGMKDYLHESSCSSPWTDEDLKGKGDQKLRGTEFHLIVHDIYTSPFKALLALGDISNLRSTGTQFTEDQSRGLNYVSWAALDALGIGRLNNGKFFPDVTIDVQKVEDMTTLAEIVSMLEAAKNTKVEFSEEHLSMMQDVLKLLLGRLQESLKQHERREDLREQFQKDMRMLLTGDSRLQGIPKHRRELLDNDKPQGGNGKGSKDNKPQVKHRKPIAKQPLVNRRDDSDCDVSEWDDNDSDVSKSDDQKPTPLQAWHKSQVELDRLDSQIKVLSGDDEAEITQKSDALNEMALQRIASLRQEPVNLTGTNKQREEIKHKIEFQIGYQKKASNQLTLIEKNKQAVCKKLKIPTNDQRARRRALNDLTTKRVNLEMKCQQLKRVYQRDDHTLWMVNKYAHLGFNSNTDYLRPGPNNIDVPTTQASHFGAMKFAEKMILD